MTHSIEQIAAARAVVQDKLTAATAQYRAEVAVHKAQLRKLEAYIWEHGEHTADSVTEDYVALRDMRSDLKAAYETEDKELKEQMAARETWLLSALDTIGAESLRTNHGTAFIQTKRRSSCGDWPSYWGYMKEHDRFDLVEKRVAQGAINKMLEEGEELPPGVNLFSERTVTVRRS